MNLHSKTMAGRVGAAGIALALCTAAAAQTQEPAPAPTAEAAREALSKKEGDVDQAKLLKETLTAADKQYSLIKRGKVALTYDLNYSYIGQQTIEANFTDDKLTLFDIQNKPAPGWCSPSWRRRSKPSYRCWSGRRLPPDRDWPSGPRDRARRCRAAWRTRFSCCLMFGIRKKTRISRAGRW